jgi:hypothetical protein
VARKPAGRARTKGGWGVQHKRPSDCRLGHPDRIAAMQLVSSLAYRPGRMIPSTAQAMPAAWPSQR